MFITEFIRNPRAVGAVVESSPDLAEMMTATVDWRSTRRVIELGSGVGSFTSVILRKMAPGCRLVAIEANAKFARRSERIVAAAGDGGLVINGAFEDHYHRALRFLGGKPDVVISGLPWAFFDPPYQDYLLSVLAKVLPVHGRFLTFGYLPGLLLPAGRRFPRRLKQVFARVDKSPTVWRNLPPAFVYRCAGPMTLR